MVNLNEKGFVGGLPTEQVKALNYCIGLFPISAMLAAAQGMIDVLGTLAEQGTTLTVRDKMTNPPTKNPSHDGAVFTGGKIHTVLRQIKYKGKSCLFRKGCLNDINRCIEGFCVLERIADGRI